jgi:hypothetical protein
MSPLTLTDILDDAAMLSFEHQLHLADVLGEHSYSVDLGGQRFAFTGDHPLTCERFQLLGTAAPGSGSWLWAWANPGGFPEPLLEAAGYVREFGRQHDVPALHQGEVPFGQLPGAPVEAHRAAGMVTEAAKAICSWWSAYSFDAGGGTWVAFLVWHPDFQLPPPEPARVTRVLTQALAELSITDHWRALYSYAQRRPLAVQAAGDRSWMVLEAPGLHLTVQFDALGRVANMRGSMGGSSPSIGT